VPLKVRLYFEGSHVITVQLNSSYIALAFLFRQSKHVELRGPSDSVLVCSSLAMRFHD